MNHTAKWFECGWSEAYRRRAKVMGKVPKEFLRQLNYCWERRNKAAKREDEQRIAAGKEPMWNLGAK